jgi:hypothetical protein
LGPWAPRTRWWCWPEPGWLGLPPWSSDRGGSARPLPFDFSKSRSSLRWRHCTTVCSAARTDFQPPKRAQVGHFLPYQYDRLHQSRTCQANGPNPSNIVLHNSLEFGNPASSPPKSLQS